MIPSIATIRAFAVLAVVPLAAAVCRGQTRQIQGGNALDANPMVGSGGINFAAPRPPINRANAIMTGNVGSGMGFRGYSPIRDSSQFFINLPSSTLSNFNAQSIDVGALQQGITNYQPHLYYAPSKTMTNVGGLERGFNTPGTGTPRSPFDYPRERMFSPVPRDPITFAPLLGRQPTGTGLAVEPGIQRVFPSAGAAGSERLRFNERLLASPLFGRTYDVPVSQLREWSDVARAVPGANREALAQAAQTPLQFERPAAPGAIQSPLDRVLGKGPVELMPQVDYTVDARLRATQPPVAMGQEATFPTAPQPYPEMPSAVQPVAEPEWLGRDRFQDMAAASRAIRQQLLGPGPQAPPEIAGAQTPTPQAPWAQEYLARPITSFVGSSPTAVNDYLARAEKDMRAGKYYSAAGVYSMAATLDPDSPLPILGHAHALIGAGEYLTAVNLLTRAIEKFPGIAFFRIDLKSFIPNLRVIEARRADLEKLLNQNEDYRLRFLLGYLEYFSGYTIPGLDDLAKAAAEAPPGSPITEFLKMLKQGRSVPPVSGAAGLPRPPAAKTK